MPDLRKLHEATTPGPWASAFPSGRIPGAIWHPQPGPTPNLAVAQNHADAALIAAMRNALPLYLALEEAASTLLSGEPFDYHRADAAWNDLRAALAALDAWKRGEK